MCNDAWLRDGLTALARAGSTRWQHGHFGCAAIAAHFLIAENSLGRATASAMAAELDSMMSARASLFEPLEAGLPVPHYRERIADALEATIDRHCPGGHNVIYAALALKALEACPEMANEAVVGGIAQAIRGVGVAEVADFSVMPPNAGRFQESLPRWAGSHELAEFVFQELLRWEPMYYEMQGRLGHLVTTSQSLSLLDEMGMRGLAVRGYTAFETHVGWVRSFITAEKSDWTEVPATGIDPLLPESWAAQHERMRASHWGYGHFFKHRYQFLDLMKRVRDPALREKARRRLGEFIINETARLGQRFA